MLSTASQARARPCSNAGSGSSSSSGTARLMPVRRAAVVAASCSTSSCSSVQAAAATADAHKRRRAAAVAAAVPAWSAGRPALAVVACRAIEEKRDTTGEAAGAPENLVSEIERLAAARRAENAPEPSASSQGGGQNPLQGALSEARLITWPRPQKALLDTALVLGIVAGTSALVFGLNVALAELSTAWYKSH